MVESKLNIVNSAIEDKHRMDTEFHKQHESSFLAIVESRIVVWGFFCLIVFV